MQSRECAKGSVKKHGGVFLHLSTLRKQRKEDVEFSSGTVKKEAGMDPGYLGLESEIGCPVQ